MHEDFSLPMNWPAVVGLLITAINGIVLTYLAIKRDKNSAEAKRLRHAVEANAKKLAEHERAATVLRRAHGMALAVLTHYKEAAEECFIEADELGIIREWDAGASIIFGWRADEVIGTLTIGDLLPPEARSEHERVARAIMSRHLEPRDSPFVAEATCKQRRRFPVEIKLGKPYQPRRSGDESTFWRYPARIKKLRLPSPEAIMKDLSGDDPKKTDEMPKAGGGT